MKEVINIGANLNHYNNDHHISILDQWMLSSYIFQMLMNFIHLQDICECLSQMQSFGGNKLCLWNTDNPGSNNIPYKSKIYIFWALK